MKSKIVKILGVIIVCIFSISMLMACDNTQGNENANNNYPDNIYNGNDFPEGNDNNYGGGFTNFYQNVNKKLAEGDIINSEDNTYQYVMVEDEPCITTVSNMIKTFTIPEKIEEKVLTKIYPGTFSRATSLKTLYLSKSIESLGIEADYWSGIYTTRCNFDIINDVGNENYRITNGFVFEKEELVSYKQEKVLNIPASLKPIDTSIFRDDDVVEVMNFEEGVNELSTGNFIWLDNLREVNFSSTVTFSNIENIYFENCNKLEALNVAENNPYLKSENGVLYAKCEDGTYTLATYPENKQDISEFRIPHYVSNINQQAFRSSKLEKIIVPETVREIRSYAFNFCFNLTELVFEGKEIFFCEEYVVGNGDDYSYNENLKIIVPRGTLEIYKNCIGLNYVSDRIKEN